MPLTDNGNFKLKTINNVTNIELFILICFREGNHPDDYSRLTYKKLLEEVCRFANLLRSKGVKKGDRVAVYMPMILEAVITLLGCARIGAVHSLVVFTLFSLMHNCF